MNEINEGMRKVNIRDGKKAIVTIGRWQPPHAGHSNLIRTVISDVKSENAGSKKKDTEGYIYVIIVHSLLLPLLYEKLDHHYKKLDHHRNKLDDHYK